MSLYLYNNGLVLNEGGLLSYAGLGTATLEEGDGYASQRAALRAFISSTGSLVPATASAAPAITLGGSSPTLSGATVAKDDTRIRYLGGHTVEGYPGIQPGTYPGYLFRSAKNLSYSASDRGQIGGIVEFDITCPRFELYEYGQGHGVRLLVDNQIAGSYTAANDGSLKYRLFDFTAIATGAVSRRVRLEFNAKGFTGGLKLDTTGALQSLLDVVNYRICWMGDSFTEGVAGMTSTTIHASYAPHASKLLGFRDYWMSGFGGTGYNVSKYPGFGATRPSLADRVGWDGIGADVYVIAMGINDSDADAVLPAKVASTLTALRANNPLSLIIVLGPWGNGAGTNIKPVVEAVVAAACAGRPGVKFLSVYDIAFTKSDATHPDAAGHAALGAAVAARIKAWLGLA